MLNAEAGAAAELTVYGFPAEFRRTALRPNTHHKLGGGAMLPRPQTTISGRRIFI